MGFCGPETPKRSPPTAQPLDQTSPPHGNDTLMGGGDVCSNGCAVVGDLLGVSGPQNPKNWSIWIEKRLRNGSGTARETAEFRPRSRPALFLDVINDRGELHCHRTRHRGGRALPVPGCPQGRFPRRSTLSRRGRLDRFGKSIFDRKAPIEKYRFGFSIFDRKVSILYT